MQLQELLAIPDAAANDAAGAADVAALKHGACINLIEVLSLCNAQRADDAPELEALALDVTDDVADSLWACADALLDAKAECCQEISSLKDDLDTGVIAGVHPPSHALLFCCTASQTSSCATTWPAVYAQESARVQAPEVHSVLPLDAQRLFVG